MRKKASHQSVQPAGAQTSLFTIFLISSLNIYTTLCCRWLLMWPIQGRQLTSGMTQQNLCLKWGLSKLLPDYVIWALPSQTSFDDLDLTSRSQVKVAILCSCSCLTRIILPLIVKYMCWIPPTLLLVTSVCLKVVIWRQMTNSNRLSRLFNLCCTLWVKNYPHI